MADHKSSMIAPYETPISATNTSTTIPSSTNTFTDPAHTSQPPPEYYRSARPPPSIASDIQPLIPPYSLHSGARGTSNTTTRKYRSEDEYLAALKSWASEKEYMEPLTDGSGTPVGLVGFYGHKTSEDYIKEAGDGFSLRRRGRKGSKGASKNDLPAPGSSAAVARVEEETAAEEDQEHQRRSSILAESEVGGQDDLVRSTTADSQNSTGRRITVREGGIPDLPSAQRRRSSLGDWLKRRRTQSIGGQ